MRITPSRLSVLLAVHRAGGIVAAADSQHLTPSAVSQQIKLLEKEAGVRVLDREPTGAVLTDAGRVLAETAERIEAGHVRIGSFSTAIRALLLPLLTVVERTMPGVVMTIEETEERSGLARLRRGELDLVLLERDERTPPEAPRAMADVPVLDEPWLVVVPPGQAAPQTLADLARVTWIDLAPSTAGAYALGRLSRRLGAPLSTRHVAYDYDVVLAMVSLGQGHALLPELAVISGRVPDGVGLARLPGLGIRQIVVRHRQTRSDPGPAVRAVLDALLIRASALELGRGRPDHAGTGPL